MAAMYARGVVRMELSPKESLPALDVVSSGECGGRIPETPKRYRGEITRTFRFGTGKFACVVRGFRLSPVACRLRYRRLATGGLLIPFSTAHAANCVRDVN